MVAMRLLAAGAWLCIAAFAADEETFDVQVMLKAAVEASSSKARVPRGCMWRQTSGCKPDGAREEAKDKPCEQPITKGASGFCDCDGDTALGADERGFECNTAPADCRGYCGIGMPPGGEGSLITSQCLAEAAQEAWKTDFQSAVDIMLQKTKRTMQRGLQGIATSVQDLVDKSTCGDVKAFAKFKEQAERLKVLASVRSLGNMDAKVKYEPLKSLMVGDVDIHTELNALIIAWQLKKGPVETGRALMAFLLEFEEETEAVVEGDGDVAAPEPADGAPAPPPPPQKEDHHDAKDVRTVHFWEVALSAAFRKLGDPHDSVTRTCFTDAAAQKAGERIEASFNTMLEKNRRSMQRGLKMVANEVVHIVDDLESTCPHLKKSLRGPSRLRTAAQRMIVLAGAKTLMNFGVHIDYEPMKALKIGGIDVHSELNTFILAWINNKGGADVGAGMASFFEDFEEVDLKDDKEAVKEEEQIKQEEQKEGSPIHKMVYDSFAKAGGGTALPAHCAPDGGQNLQEFTEGVNGALEHMLQKRMKTMQQGLKELADTTDRLVLSLPRDCQSHAGASLIHKAAKKVKKLTRRTIVDYGTHIKYEAMKSLKVGNIAVHLELNNFIGAWKLRSIKEAGNPFGELFAKLATIEGHDEL